MAKSSSGPAGTTAKIDTAIAFTDVQGQDDGGCEMEEVLFEEENFAGTGNDEGIPGLEEAVLFDGADDNNAADFSDKDF
ncbi:hypothetical protein DL769_010577 [Monosporascus sp. CRB-8-3]|nr:hypothetical protein DL769_010577 [Monosporascus sp. CRB-8-3]